MRNSQAAMLHSERLGSFFERADAEAQEAAHVVVGEDEVRPALLFPPLCLGFYVTPQNSQNWRKIDQRLHETLNPC